LLIFTYEEKKERGRLRHSLQYFYSTDARRGGGRGRGVSPKEKRRRMKKAFIRFLTVHNRGEEKRRRKG